MISSASACRNALADGPGPQERPAAHDPVNLIEYQGRWLVAPYGEVSWVRNVRAAGEVELRRAGTAERCLAREATAEEAVPVLRSYCGSSGSSPARTST